MRFEPILPIAFAMSGTFYLLAVAWPLSKIDIREHRLPNRLVLPAFPISLVGQTIASAISNQWQNLTVALAKYKKAAEKVLASK